MVFHYAMHPVDQLRKEMDRLLSSFAGTAANSPSSAAGYGQPALNVWENGEALFVELELPGVKSEQLDVAVVGNELSIKVERPELEEEGVTYHRRERSAGSFTRMLRLPVDVDANRVQAELRNGVLTITLPKAEAARPRKIRVTST